jgi:ketosteroid isomerase-like protein
MAPDAFILNPDPTSAFAAYSESQDDDRTLQWRPRYVGIARSGDLAFSTGPVFFAGRAGAAGNYLSIWRRQPDGSWKWVFDGGVGVVDHALPGDEEAPRFASVAAEGAGSAEAAMAQVNTIELQIGAEARTDAAMALRTRLAVDAVVKRRGLEAATAPDAMEQVLSAPAPQIAFAQLRAEASQAGDLVFSVGTARWTDEQGAEQHGFYCRVWQLREDGWRILYDQITRRAPSSG